MQPIPLLVLLAGLPLAAAILPGQPIAAAAPGIGARCRTSGTPRAECRAMAETIALLLRQDAEPQPALVPAGRRTW